MKRILLSRSVKLFVILNIVVILPMQAQDIFFSQFYSAPLFLNPALTGFSPNDMQVALNYRNNENGIIQYSTYGFSADFKLARLLLDPDIAAAGIIVTQDDQLGGSNQVKSLNVMFSGAYHKSIDGNGNHVLAVGLQSGFTQKQANPESFSYPTQWDPQAGYVPGIDNNEEFKKDNVINYDMNAGVFWLSKIDKYNAVYGGISTSHITKPKQTLQNLNDYLKLRYLTHVGAKIRTGELTNIIPAFMFTRQNRAMQIIEGMQLEYKVGESKQSSLKLGAWFRHSDKALIFNAGVKIGDLQFGIGSDFVSRVQRVSESTGALEFYIIYNAPLRDKARLNANPRNKY